MRIKRIIAGLMVGIMTLSIAACSSGSEEPQNPDNTGEAETTTQAEVKDVKEGKKGKIEFWTVFTGADGTSMQKMIDEYNATEPDYTVVHRAMDANDLYLKLPLAVQSGQDVPDVSISHVERIPSFQENGFLVDYTEAVNGSEVKKENYIEKAWKMTDIAGGHYGVPLDVHSYITYVNMDLYEKYGNGALDDGVLTWDEIRESADACVKDEIIPIGMAWLRVKFLAGYAQKGGTLSTDGKNPDFNNDMAMEVLDNWTGLYNDGYTQKEGDDAWKLFLGGKVMYCPEGAWMYNSVKEVELNAKMVDYPVYDANTKGNWTSSHQFVLPKNDNRDADKTKGVLEFINWIGNNSLEWAKAGQVPAHNSIKDNKEFQDMPQAFLADENEELKIYDYKYYGFVVETLDKVLPDVLFGRTTAKDAMDQAVQETKDRIETESME